MHFSFNIWWKLPLFNARDESKAPSNPPRLKRFKTHGAAQLGLLAGRWLAGANPWYAKVKPILKLPNDRIAAQMSWQLENQIVRAYFDYASPYYFMVIKCTHLRNVARRQTSGISWMGGFLWFRASNDVQLHARVICAHLFGCRRRPKWVIGMSERFFRPGRQFVLLPYLYNQLVECNRTLVRRVRGAIVHFPLLFGAAVL